jgi:DNA invertase Pin-like site-specific DNA recombinase
MSLPQTPAVGYSYVRFSSGEQAKGDSLRRQTAGDAERWCERHGVTLDASETLHDLRRSAFKGKHRTDDKAALTGFLRRVEANRIAPGSYLIVEALDRLTREEVLVATHLLTGMLLKGIRIVQLRPVELVYTEKAQMHEIMLMIVELSRGHSESAMKSERVHAAWAEKKKAAREGRDQPPRRKTGRVSRSMTSRLPAWVCERDGRLEPIPERATLVRRLFALALEGKGVWQIVKTLEKELVKPWGTARHWSKAYVRKILTGGAAAGRHQPLTRGEPDGPAIDGYYPAVVDAETLDRVRSALAGRKDGPGRLGKKVANLFTGLLHDAATRTRMLIAWQTQGSGAKKRKARMLVSAASMEGAAPTVSFPYHVFESALLSRLEEVDPADVFGVDARESEGLAAELAGVEAQLAKVEGQLTVAADLAPLVRAARALESRRADLTARLAAARAAEANPPASALSEARTLIGAAADPEARLRLRQCLRHAVEEIRVLIVPRRAEKLCVMQVHFRGDGVRDYLIHYRPGRRGVQSAWEAASFAGAGLPPLDLRRPADATALEKALREGVE